MDVSNSPDCAETFNKTITSEPANLASIRQAGETLARRIGFSDEDAGKIVLVLDEALSNVIKHGYDYQPGRPIHIVMEPCTQDQRRGIRVVITDQGKRVDPSQIVSRDLDDVRPGGLGVFLMKSIMDSVVHAAHDSGMRLEMIKYLPGGDA